jgi:hypothetical protein
MLGDLVLTWGRRISGVSLLVNALIRCVSHSTVRSVGVEFEGTGLQGEAGTRRASTGTLRRVRNAGVKYIKLGRCRRHLDF